MFATAGNISTLNIGENLVGIGSFAFYECTSLSSVSFGNGLKVLGNWAFAACGTLNNVAIPDACLLQQIGDHAFYSCIGLDTFRVPISVKFIGDYAFAECSFLNSIDLCNSGNDRSGSILQELGWNVFENCQTLSSLTFPYNYRETPDISIVKGCKNLHYIAAQGDSFAFTEKKTLQIRMAFIALTALRKCYRGSRLTVLFILKEPASRLCMILLRTIALHLVM